MSKRRAVTFLRTDRKGTFAVEASATFNHVPVSQSKAADYSRLVDLLLAPAPSPKPAV